MLDPVSRGVLLAIRSQSELDAQLYIALRLGSMMTLGFGRRRCWEGLPKSDAAGICVSNGRWG